MEKAAISPTTLTEIEEGSGYLNWRGASPNHIVFPYRRRFSLKSDAKTLKHCIATPRTLRLYAYLSEALGDYATAANCQEQLKNAAEQERLSNLSMMAWRFTPFLKPGQVVGALASLNEERGVWGMLVLKPVFDNPELLVTQMGPYGHWEVLKRTPLHEDAENAHLTTRTGELLLVQDRTGGSWQPTSVTGYRWQGGRLVTTVSAFSEHGISIQKHRGRWILQTFQCIGNLSHAHQPRWPAIYEKSGGQWRAADRHYPELFREVYATLKFRTRQFPREETLPAYLNWTRKLLNGERVGPPPKKVRNV